MAVAGRHQGRGTSGLAHRMLSDGRQITMGGYEGKIVARRPEIPPSIRYPWRRYRSRLSASRERTRAKLLRLSRSAHGERLDAQRLPAGRRRQDVEEPRQLRHDQRVTE